MAKLAADTSRCLLFPSRFSLLPKSASFQLKPEPRKACGQALVILTEAQGGLDEKGSKDNYIPVTRLFGVVRPQADALCKTIVTAP